MQAVHILEGSCIYQADVDRAAENLKQFYTKYAELYGKESLSPLFNGQCPKFLFFSL